VAEIGCWTERLESSTVMIGRLRKASLDIVKRAKTSSFLRRPLWTS
jgi:hypothetical protein